MVSLLIAVVSDCESSEEEFINMIKKLIPDAYVVFFKPRIFFDCENLHAQPIIIGKTVSYFTGVGLRVESIRIYKDENIDTVMMKMLNILNEDNSLELYRRELLRLSDCERVVLKNILSGSALTDVSHQTNTPLFIIHAVRNELLHKFKATNDLQLMRVFYKALIFVLK